VRVPASSEPRDVRVTFNVDKHGMIVLQSAELMEPLDDDSAEQQTEKKEEEKKDAGDSKEGGDAGEAGKKKFKKVVLSVDIEQPGLSVQQVKDTLELEARMAYEDQLIVDTADKKNEVEAYIYAMRDKLDGPLKSFATEKEKDALKSLMTATENWLYDEGYETTKQEYERKLVELKKIGNPVDGRFHQHSQRPAVVDALKKQIELCKSFVIASPETHPHVTDEERDRVRKEFEATEEWFYDLLSKQGELALSAEPVLTCEAISAKRMTLFQTTNPIMSSKPKPKAAESKPAESKTAADENKADEAKTHKDAEADSK
jgi:heat shock 70kDa protein 4